ncbi:MAG: hypothetical protein GJ677_00845 [Rhodobacteraceae bacterium]|nr:hypothetical protein [Paracoccaceae bacterium]
MKKFGSLFSCCLAALVATVFPAFVLAEDTTANASLRPSISHVARLVLATDTQVEIHRSAQGGAEERKHVYFHKPAFLFLKRDAQEELDWPDIVHEVEETSDGGVAIVLQVLSSSQTIRQLARDLILQPAPEGDQWWIQEQGVDPEAVTVREWPVTDIKVTIGDIDDRNASLATIEQTLLDTERHRGLWRVRIPIKNEKRERVQNLLLDGDALFSFHYKYEGSTQSEGRATRKYIINAFNAANAEMSSEQQRGQAPIFQDEKQKIISKIEESTVTVLSANNIALLDHFSTDWDKTLFQEATQLTDLPNPPSNLLKSVDSYLERLVDTMKTENEEYSRSTNTDETNTELKIKTKGEWKTGWQGSAEVDLTKEWKSKLEKEHGITLKETETKNVVVAHDVAVSFLNSSWREGIQRATTYAFISVPSERGFQKAATVKQDRRVGYDDLGVLDQPSGPFVPLGTALCYFGAGDAPPAGYAFLSDGFEWPSAPWVPDGIKGEVLESSEGLLLSLTNKEAEVGKSWTEGTITIPSATIPGSAFTLSNDNGITINALNNTGTLGVYKYKSDESHDGWYSERFRVTFGKPTTRNIADNKGVTSKPVKIVGSVAGQSEIPARRIQTNTPEAMPNNMKCRWIVRLQ